VFVLIVCILFDVMNSLKDAQIHLKKCNLFLEPHWDHGQK